MLTPEETVYRARKLLVKYRVPHTDILTPASFKDFVAATADTIRYSAPHWERSEPKTKELLESLKALYDDYERLLAGDPMVLYTPKHKIAAEFHKSRAKIRLWFGGNRTSKTQSGYAEQYYVATRRHPFWSLPKGATAVGVIGLAFSQYAPNVFEKKMVTGEPGNPLAPMFPEGGRWLYSYNEKKRILTLACPECAHAWRAKACTHPKSSITLYSDEGGWEVLAGAQFNLIHIDEHVREGFFAEAIQRTQAIKGRMVVTLTPAFGPEAWEERRLHKLAKSDPAENKMDPSDPKSPPYVEVFTISQYDAGITSIPEIEASKRTMDEFEIECRIYGRTMPDAKNAVFDRHILAAMKKHCLAPTLGQLVVSLKDLNASTTTHAPSFAPTPQEPTPSAHSTHPSSTSAPEFSTAIELAAAPEEIEFKGEAVHDTKEWAGLRVWKKPEKNAAYLVAVDVAAGLSPKTRDPSCASVLRVIVGGDGMPSFDLVAQYHGWINPFVLADEVKKLALWYNTATVAIETTGGYGSATMMRLREQLFYPNIWRDLVRAETVAMDASGRLGVDTNVSTKPLMVAALQQCIRQGRIVIPDVDTIYELSFFQQETTTSTGQRLVVPRYKGADGAHDDRVMSLVVGVFAGLRAPPIDFFSSN